MGRCSCEGTTCQCVLQDGATINFSGAGSAGTPYTGEIIPAGAAPLLIDPDAYNRLDLGSNGLLEVIGPWTLLSESAPVGNVGGGVDTLATKLVPANTLRFDGDRLRFRAFLTMTSAGDNNSFVFRLGGVAIFTRPLVAATNSSVVVEGEIVRTGPSAQRASVSAMFTDDTPGVSSVEVSVTGMGLNNAAPQTFLVTGQTAGASNNQVVLESLTIDVVPS